LPSKQYSGLVVKKLAGTLTTKNYMINKLDYCLACQISDWLLKTNQAFCFVGGYGLISKEQCQEVINVFNTLKQ